MPILYVIEQGAQLAREGERLIVRRGRTEIAATPVHRVEQVVLMGRIQPTCAALDLLLQRDIPLHYVTAEGRLKGTFLAPLGKNVLLRRAQFRRADDPDFRLAVARAIVTARLHNQRLGCLRWGRNHPLPQAEQIAHDLDRLTQRIPVVSAAELLGLEGAGSRAYYGLLRQVVSDHLPFPARTRRPARDPVSALLNLASGLLRLQVLTALQIVGLDPHLGFYHTLKYGRPALALDLMEEFRPLLADAVAVAAINRNVIRTDDFREEQGACLLTEEALERFVALFDRRLREELTHPVTGHQLSYRQCLQLQARVLAKAILGELPAYVGFMLEH